MSTALSTDTGFEHEPNNFEHGGMNRRAQSLAKSFFAKSNKCSQKEPCIFRILM